MTNYNDGKWHNAAGTMWPVHENTMAERIWVPNTGDFGRIDFGTVGGMDWASEDGRTTAFRVVKEHLEPRRCWTLGPHKFDTSDEAMNFRDGVTKGHPDCHNEPITEWVEVMK